MRWIFYFAFLLLYCCGAISASAQNISPKYPVSYDTTELNFIARYYFTHGKLIDEETIGHNRFAGIEPDPEKTLLSETRRALRLLNRKVHSINQMMTLIPPEMLWHSGICGKIG